MKAKTCKQCGELKPIEQFRRYYGGRKGTYTMCKQCERINSREKYLVGKADRRTEAEEQELAKIHELYILQSKLGLQPPIRSGRSTSLVDDLDAAIETYAAMAEQAAVGASTTPAPYELTKWLTEPLTEEPDYYLDEVYEELTNTYRPCTGINRATMMPEYDNTYKDVLDSILDRFNAYEDSYYEGAE